MRIVPNSEVSKEQMRGNVPLDQVTWTHSLNHPGDDECMVQIGWAVLEGTAEELRRLFRYGLEVLSVSWPPGPPPRYSVTTVPVGYNDFSLPRCSFCHTQLGLPHHPLCQRPHQSRLRGTGKIIDSQEIGEEMGG